MANNKSWSKDFHNVIKDTDRNLASIKKQLQVKTKANSSPYTPKASSSLLDNSPSMKVGKFQDSLGFTSTPSLNRKYEESMVSKKMDSSLSFKSNNLNLDDRFSIESPSSNLKGLFSKVEELSKTIMSLKEVVQLQEKDLQSLKENHLDIENKISKTKNIDSITLDLQFQIDSIYSIISGQQRHDHSASCRLLTDKQQHITSLEEDINTIRREASQIKQKIKTLERDIQTNSRNIGCEISCIEKDVKYIAENQNRFQRSAKKKEHFLENVKNELHKMSEELNGLKDECSRSKIHLPKVSPDLSSSIDNFYSSLRFSSSNKKSRQRNGAKKRHNLSSPVTTMLSFSDLEQSLEESFSVFELSDSKQHNANTKSKKDFLQSLNGSINGSERLIEKELNDSMGTALKNSFDSEEISLNESLNNDFDDINNDLLEGDLLTYDPTP